MLASAQLKMLRDICPMKAISRRRFLKTSLAGTAVCTLSPRSWSQVVGANDDIRVAVVGINGRGGSHIDEFGKIKGVRVTALCDVDLDVLDRRARNLEGVEKYQDVRRLLKSKDIDVVSIATTNHWHSLITIWACQAGKDVYVEKPCSHNVFEGRKCVEAARKYNRIVQHGTQSRSNTLAASAAAIVKSGKYGKLLVSKGYCCKPRWTIGFKPMTAPPANLDFDIWTGPAPKQPFHANLVHYNWHWFWDFGNGDIGNQGVHEVDVARWALGGATLPTKVWSLGGRFAYEDQGQAPNTQMAVYDYGGVLLVFEVRGLVDKHPDFKFKVLNEYYTTEGMIADGKFHPRNGATPEPLARFDVKVTPGGAWGSFLQAVRSRKVEDLNADVEHGHYSAALCHLANISYRLGEKVSFDHKFRALS